MRASVVSERRRQGRRSAITYSRIRFATSERRPGRVWRGDRAAFRERERECWNKAHHKSVSRADFCRRSLNLIRTPSRRVAACVRGGAQGVSWSATYLHPNIKPLRLVPIILDKRQDSMMYCRGAYRVSPFADFPGYGPSLFVLARPAEISRIDTEFRVEKALLSIIILLSVHGERMEAVDFATNYNRDSHRHDTRKQMPFNR